MEVFKYLDVPANASGPVKEGHGVLHTLIVPKPTIGSVSVTDGNDNFVRNIISLPVGFQGSLQFDCEFERGLFVSFSNPDMVTITYR